VTLDPDACYAALKTRDARFDGRFFTGVRTTGIYCRPVCPARTPKRGNVTFFSSAAAAEEAGFRACRRCRPDTAPGSAAWAGTSSVVQRALRLIEDGALDDGSVDDLADRLGLGARQLRRLFREHLGAPPSRFATTRRAHFARRLLETTSLPITQVAQAAGFGSLRRFHEVMRASFGAPPGELRRGASGDAERFEVAVRVAAPYDFERLVRFFETRAVPGMERTGEGVYARTLRVGERTGWVEARCVGESLRLAIDVGLAPVALQVVSRMRRQLDADADAETIEAHLAEDPVLDVSARPGLRVPGVVSLFEAAVRAVLGQQVSRKAARTLTSRLVAAHGLRVGDRGRAFPLADALVDAELRGVPEARASAVRGVARLFVEQGDDALARLEEVRGVGPWTRAYAALRSGDCDALPASDLILKRALGVTAREVETRTRRWRPYRAYGVMHAWTAYGEEVET